MPGVICLNKPAKLKRNKIPFSALSHWLYLELVLP
jgi:hypothetical protein